MEEARQYQATPRALGYRPPAPEAIITWTKGQSCTTLQSEHLKGSCSMDPHTAAKLDLAQIRGFVDDLLTAHTLCLPDWLKTAGAT